MNNMRSLARRAIILLAAAMFELALSRAALAATLSFTLPTDTQPVSPRGEIVECSGGPAARSIAGWRLFAQIQSPTWARFGPLMNSSPASWSLHMPAVRSEAAPHQIASASSKHLPNGGSGQRITVTAPDSLDGMPILVYWVETFNDSGKASCPSNLKIGRLAP